MDLLFHQPAKEFTETLPIGNGRLGALIYGEVMREQIVLNENSMWSGSKEKTDREDAAQYLEEIRSLLAKGEHYNAEQIFSKHFTCLGKGSNYAHGSTVPFGCYQILGRLHLSYFQALSSSRESCDCVKNYKRRLDIKKGKAEVSFETFGIQFKRTYWVSKKQEAIYIHLTASKEGKINVGIGIDRDERFVTETLSDHSLLMSGQLADGYGTDKGIRYACVVGAKAMGGSVSVDSQRIFIKDANEAWIAITANTNMSGFMYKEKIDEQKKTKEENEQALNIDLDEMQRFHEQEMVANYVGMEVSFGKREELAQLPTSERVKRFLNGEQDEELIAFYVMYARYLLYSCSREGSLPANLQGIWADEIQTPWNGDWHLNAQQMIYWLAEKGNLSTSHIPYLILTEQLSRAGQKTARAYYSARGWLAHTCTNPWGFTSPCESVAWGSTTGSPAWQCHHLWEHYLYTQDLEYLKWAYPIMKEAALFYLDMLVEEKTHGWLVTSPSSSPENSFLDQEGRICSICEGPAYDRELVASLFSYCMQAQYVLKNDVDFLEELTIICKKLAPIELAHDGRIMEWGEEYTEAFVHHRHVSHLWGVYPGQMMTKEYTNELAEGAKKSLITRGSSTVGWAIAYRMCLWARLREAEEAYQYVDKMFRYATGKNLWNLAYHCDETVENPELPDLEHCRYPFQIDGNQGNATGILLMLEDDYAYVKEDGTMDITIFLLPALPKALRHGKVTGICAKGTIKMDFTWKDYQLTSVYFYGKIGTKFHVCYQEKQYEIVLKSNPMEWKIEEKNNTL